MEEHIISPYEKAPLVELQVELFRSDLNFIYFNLTTTSVI